MEPKKSVKKVTFDVESELDLENEDPHQNVSNETVAHLNLEAGGDEGLRTRNSNSRIITLDQENQDAVRNESLWDRFMKAKDTCVALFACVVVVLAVILLIYLSI